MSNNFYVFLQEMYGPLSIPSFICASILCIGLTLLFWTLFISTDKKQTKRIKCLIFGGVSIAAYVLLWSGLVIPFLGSILQPNILSISIVPALCMMIMAVGSLILVLFKYRQNKRAYFVPLSLFVVALILFISLLILHGTSFKQLFEITTGALMVTELEGFGRFIWGYALTCSICLCVAVTFWLWMQFVSEGKKQKLLWLSSRVSLAIFILLVVFCPFLFNGLSVKDAQTNPFLLLVMLALCLSLSAIVSLGLVLWKCRKKRRAYLVPLLLIIASFILYFIFISIVIFYNLWFLFMWWVEIVTST